MNSKKEINNKKKKIIIKILITAILLMIVLGIFAGVLIYKTIGTDKQNGNVNVNTLYIEEKYNEEQNNEIITVELENQNNQNIADDNKEEQLKNTNTNANVGTKPKNVESTYYIKVNNQANVVTIYKKDKAGKYTVPVKAMVCSIGTATPTSGVYSISDKYTWRLLERKCIWTVCL